ncbi:gluconokinase [Loktanella agnita]|uniref:gluconokinase n=1 Tax=Loktanella agnita TaxID=287097 RepID=UPI003987FCA0
MKPAIMIMGVSGCGKSSVGAALAAALGGAFLDGDDYHPQSNVDHMVAGQPLTDAMRWPWLDRLAAVVTERRGQDVTVFACSALKRSYRDHLRAGIADLQIVYLDAPQALIAARLGRRQGHFMPPALLASQYAALEPPLRAILVSVDQPIAGIVAAVTPRLSLTEPAPPASPLP